LEKTEMKKLLLVSTAIAGLAVLSAPAHAAVKLDLGGYFSGYGVYADNDEAGNMHKWDLRRDTEVHVSGETTLDNGLTVGFHTELGLGNDGTSNAGALSGTTTDEAYAYFSGGWGRFNLGSEDGSSYLLQVAAPSADSNVDGLRTYVQALNPSGAVQTVFTAGIPGLRYTSALDYDHTSDNVPNTERLTYLSPKFNGFQAGVSYAPTSGQQRTTSAVFPLTTDNDNGQYDKIWDASARWDGEFQGFGIGVGGGYSHASLENFNRASLAIAGNNEDTAPLASDGLAQWNAGANVSYMGFSLGGSYLRATTKNLDSYDAGDNAAASDTQASLNVIERTYVVGLGYDNGPYHVGASYLNQNQTRDGDGVGADGGNLGKVDATADRWTVGAGYTFAPGMTFRGAVAWGTFDSKAIANDAGAADGVSVGGGAVAAQNQDFKQSFTT